MAAALTKRILDIYKERERDDYMIKANVVCVCGVVAKIIIVEKVMTSSEFGQRGLCGEHQVVVMVARYTSSSS